MTFGEFIKLQREQKGWTQTELGFHLGINSSAISRIENNTKSLSIKKISSLSKIFNLSTQKLHELYLADKFVDMVIKYDCPKTVFSMAEEQLKYKRAR